MRKHSMVNDDGTLDDNPSRRLHTIIVPILSIGLLLGFLPQSTAAEASVDYQNDEETFLVLVQGMRSSWACDQSPSEFSDLVDFLRQSSSGVSVPNDGWAVFSYRDPSDPDAYCDTSRRVGSYLAEDTCHSVFRYAEYLRRWYSEEWADQERVDLITHSMGGVVAAVWIAQYGPPSNLHSITTLDSPLQGRDWAEFFTFVPEFFDDCDLTATRYADLTPGSPAIEAIADMPQASKGLFTTIRNAEDIVVGAEESQLPGSWLDTLLTDDCLSDIYLSNHWCVFDNPLARNSILTTLQQAGTSVGDEDSPDWPWQGHDSARTRFNSAETSLRPPLETAWTTEGLRDEEILAADGRVFVSSSDFELSALSLVDGTEQWTTDQAINPAGISDGLVFSESPTAPGAVNATNGELAWTTNFWCRPGLIPGGYVHDGCNARAIDGTGLGVPHNWCRDAANAFQGGSLFSTENLLIDRALFACEPIGCLGLPCGSGLKWEFETTDLPLKGTLAVRGGRVFVATAGRVSNTVTRSVVYSVSAYTGDGLRVHEYADSHVASTHLALGYGKVFFGADDGKVRALDSGNLSLEWERELGGSFIRPISDPVLANGYLYVVSREIDSSIVHALDVDTGESLWSFELPGRPAHSSPIVADGKLLVLSSCGNCRLHAFSAASRFTDVPSDSTFYSDIGWLADRGITKGCNPPTNDRFCPNGLVTRGQMASFLVRALDLPDHHTDLFRDDADSVHHSDINSLGAAGITRGCNPPTNDRYCPNEPVTRGQMAAFLVRALDLGSPGAGDLFVDDDGSVFEEDIDRLRTAGITRGCNPPTNDRFCPDDLVTRGQMAAFLRRSLD